MERFGAGSSHRIIAGPFQAWGLRSNRDCDASKLQMRTIEVTGFEPAATEKALHGRGLGNYNSMEVRVASDRCGQSARMVFESGSCSI